MAASVRHLAALGVVRYRPRDLPEMEEVEGIEEVDPGREERRAEEPLSALAPVEKAEAKRPAAPAPTPVPSTESESLAFRLAFWQPTPGLVVLSSLPPGRRSSEEEVIMLQRLLRAIHSLPGELPAGELIDWPLAAGADSGIAGARDMLGVFLDVKARLQAFPHALLMGESAARVAGGRETFRVGEDFSLECGARAWVTHSLYEMAREPALKKPTWETLQRLVSETQA